MVVDKFYIKKFLLAGKCYCRIENQRSGNCFDYIIKKSKNKDSEMYFVQIVEGSHKSYAGVVYLKDDLLYFSKGVKGNASPYDMEIQALLYVYNNVDKLPNYVKVYHFGKCAVCGRKLTDDDSVERGVGPECWKKINLF